jgi:RHS repeat-associated protein
MARAWNRNPQGAVGVGITNNFLWHAVVGLIAVAFSSFILPDAASANGAPPNYSETTPAEIIGSASLLSPTQVDGYYGSTTTSTKSVPTTQRPNEIVELARSLAGNPAADPSNPTDTYKAVDRIYQYVNNNIDVVWEYGLQKGAVGAIVDHSGTAFDQAMLMVELVRQYVAANNMTSHIQAVNYQVGTIQLSGQQFYDWSGIQNAQAACQLLSSGSIGAQINGTTDPTCASYVSTNVSTVTLNHVWVTVKIDGVIYSFDPAYKVHLHKAGINLAVQAGMTANQTLTQATTGMTTGTDAGTGQAYVAGLNEAALDTALQGYGANILAYIKANPSAHMEDIVSGEVIQRSEVPPAGLRLPALPYPSTVQHTWTDPGDGTIGIPDQYRTTMGVNLSVYGPVGIPWSSYSQPVFFNKTFFIDEIYGRKLAVAPSFDQGDCGGDTSNAPNPCQQTVNLMLTDESGAGVAGAPAVLGTYTDAFPHIYRKGSLVLTVSHPYAVSATGATVADKASDAYMYQVVTKLVNTNLPFVVVHAWGDSNGLAAKWDKRFDTLLPPNVTPSGCETCGQPPQQSTGDATREGFAANWIVQSSKAARLHAAIGGSVYQLHHAVGVAAADITLNLYSPYTAKVIYNNDSYNPDNLPLYWNVVDKFDRIDVDTSFSLTSKTADPAGRRAAIFAIAATSDALEGSVVNQTADLPDTVSTTTRFEWGNAPPSGEDLYGSNASRRVFTFTGGNVGYAPTLVKAEGLTNANYSATDPCAAWNGGIFSYPSVQPQLCTWEAQYWMNGLAGAISAYTAAGFTVVASEESHLGPGQPFGAPNIIVGTDLSGHQFLTYTTFPSMQRGGALIATLYAADGVTPLQIAHVAVNWPQDSGAPFPSKGGGGGVQPDNDSTYNPATAADILKAKFVDHSNAMGVDLATGKLSYTSPVSLSVGSGNFPKKLSAQLIYHEGQPLSAGNNGEYNIASQPGPPFSTNWHNMLSMSGSGMEALGATDPRAAAGTIAAFMAIQDIYKAGPSSQRDVAGVLVNAWWVKQLNDNVVTATLGASSQQFDKLVDGTWITPGAAPYATLAVSGSRVYLNANCGRPPYPPYPMSRGWDYSGLSFQITNAHGDQQNFGYWHSNFSDGTNYCALLHGFHLNSWVFPKGVTINLTYAYDGSSFIGQPIDAIATVSNSYGRTLTFDPNGAFINNTLTGSDARQITMSEQWDGFGNLLDTHTDPMHNQTSFLSQPISWWGTPNYLRLTKVYTADNPPAGVTNYVSVVPTNAANIEYDYDTQRRVATAWDADALLLGNRPAYQFYVSDHVRGERMDPTGVSYAVEYDIYKQPLEYFDELGHETSLAHDGLGRATGYTYPEGDQQLLAYDSHNNEISFTKVAKPGSGLANIVVSAIYDQNLNKPLTITDAKGNVTALTYIGSGGGAGELATATRPRDIDNNPVVYNFTYSSVGDVLTATDPTGLVTQDVYDSAGNLLSTAVDPSHINSVTQFSYDANGDATTHTDPLGNVSNLTYDVDGRKVFEIAPAPSSATTHRPTIRHVYDVLGREIETDKGYATTTNGSDFVVLQTENVTLDPVGNKLQTITQAGVTQMNYDGDNRVVCTAVRMNSAVYNALPDACSLSTVGDEGQDHIVKTIYNLDGATYQTIRGFGTSAQETYATYTYGGDGEPLTMKDANGNLTTNVYDGLLRLTEVDFPVSAPPAGASDPTDREQYQYDVSGNRTQLIKRDGATVITFCYDNLNRQIQKYVHAATCNATGSATDVFTDYDTAGRPLHVHYQSRSGTGVDYAYDTAGRVTSETTALTPAALTISYQYDLAGRRTRVTWPDALYAGYLYDNDGRLTTVNENGATSGLGLLATFSYDDLGHRISLSRGNGASTTYSYDNADRLTALNQSVSSSSFVQNYAFGYNHASELIGRSNSNSSYDWTNHTNGTVPHNYDGLNRDSAIAAIGAPAACGPTSGYDCNGNLLNDGTRSFTYDAENRLLTASAPTAVSLAYDPTGRLKSSTASGITTQFLYDGTRLVGEYNSSGSIQQRYVHGAGTDEPLVWYVGSGTTTRRWLHQDAQGSVIAYSDASGHVTSSQVYAYGAYGEPNSSTWSGSRFQYTGQIQIPEAKLYYYKARMYDPMTGRFLQTDPIEYKDDLDLYAYVSNDPLDRTDSTGKCGELEHTSCPPGKSDEEQQLHRTNQSGAQHRTPYYVTGSRLPRYVATEEHQSGSPAKGTIATIAVPAVAGPIAEGISIPLGGTLAAVLGPLLLSGDTAKSDEKPRNPDRPSDNAIKKQCIKECVGILERPGPRAPFSDRNETDFAKCVGQCIKDKQDYWDGKPE